MPARASATPSSRSAGGDHQTFGEHLTDQLSTARTDCGADSELPAASGGANNQQVRHVGAGNQQHEGHRAHERHDRGPDVADQVVEHRYHVEVQAGSLLDWKVLAEIGGNAVGDELRPLDAHSWLEPAEHAEHDVVPVGRVDVDSSRGPHFWRALGADTRRQQQLEARSQDADDARAAVAKLDVLADDRLIAAKAPQPERVAENRGQRWSGCSCLIRQQRNRRRIVGHEITAHQDARAQHTKQVGCGPTDLDLFGVAARRGQRHAAGRNHPGELVEHLGRLLLEVAQIRWREGPVVDVARAKLTPHQDESLRVGIRQRTQQHGVDDAEDGRARPDPQGDRDRRDGRKPDVLSETPSGVSQILDECFHGSNSASARFVPDGIAVTL